MTIADILASYPQEVIWVLSHLLELSPGQVRGQAFGQLSPQQEEKLQEIWQDYQSGRPLQYAIGRWNFYGYDFKVDERALIPRPETELLVELIIKDGTAGLDILDLATGSGVIALSLALAGQAASIMATDLSAQALSLAQENCEFLSEKWGKNLAIAFRQTDLFQGIQEKFNIIVSNPPYIADTLRDKLDPHLAHEPAMALYAGPQGMDFYQRIAGQAGHYLKEGGRLYLEIGFDQGQKVSDLLAQAGFEEILCYQDYAGQDRIIRALK